RYRDQEDLAPDVPRDQLAWPHDRRAPRLRRLLRVATAAHPADQRCDGPAELDRPGPDGGQHAHVGKARDQPELTGGHLLVEREERDRAEGQECRGERLEAEVYVHRPVTEAA